MKRARTPFNRKAKPDMEKETDAEAKARTELQRAAAQRTLDAQTERDAKNAGAHVDTKLTTAGHVGKHPIEPDKDPAMEGLKTGAEALVDGATGVTTAPQKNADGETTDEVVTDPDVGAENLGGPLDEAQRTAEAAKGGKKKGRGRPKKK